jgi:DHA1 family tetracycline resistance protein-like MFS transporter
MSFNFVFFILQLGFFKFTFMYLLPLLFTIFLDSLGFGLVFPLLSPLIMNQETAFFSPETSVATRGLIFGFLISSFCIGQFFGGPILGALSDRKGRKKILLVTLWIACISYLLSALSVWVGSIALLFICRLLAGVAAGNFAIAQSIVTDCSEEKEKTKNFALVGMAWGAGFILGPFLGGRLSDPNLFSWCDWTTPFFAASLLCLFNIILMVCKLKETLPAVQIRKISVSAGVHHLKTAFKIPELRGVFATMFIFCLGWGFFTEFSPIFLIRTFDFSPPQIGNFYACVGIWVAVCQGILIRPFLKRFAPEKLLLGALISLAFTLSLMLFVKNPLGLYLVLPLLAFPESLIFPTASTLVSNLSSKDAQGEMFGIHNSIQWAAIGISPLFSGALVALYPHLPITAGSVCMLLAFSLFFWVIRGKKTEAAVQNQE